MGRWLFIALAPRCDIYITRLCPLSSVISRSTKLHRLEIVRNDDLSLGRDRFYASSELMHVLATAGELERRGAAEKIAAILGLSRSNIYSYLKKRRQAGG